MHNSPRNKPVDPDGKEPANKTQPAAKKAPIVGVVTNCLQLNVRDAPYPSAKTISVISALSKVTLEDGDHNESFYKVRTEDGVLGFCLKKFITLPLQN